MRPPKYCKPCDSRTHNESECWGECENVIIKASIADTKRYSSNNKEILNQKEQIKLPQKERRKGIEGLAKKQQSIILTQDEKKKKKKKHLKRNRPQKQILLKTDMLQQDPQD